LTPSFPLSGQSSVFQNENGVLEIKGHGLELAQNVETDEAICVHGSKVPDDRALTKRALPFPPIRISKIEFNGDTEGRHTPFRQVDL
jgi:hypothetical protein